VNFKHYDEWILHIFFFYYLYNFNFLFVFVLLSIDASKEDGSLGRLINDDHRQPNCRMKKINVNEKPHLCLFALHDIKEGEEITYDYGGSDCPWRTQVSSSVNSEEIRSFAKYIKNCGQHRKKE